MSIKLVHVTSSLQQGGAELVLYMLVRELRAAGYEQTVIYFHDGYYKDKIKELGIKTIAIEGAYALYDPWFVMRLYRTLRAEAPQVIHSMLWAANVMSRICARLLRIPLVCAYHNNVSQDGLMRALLDCLTLHCADRLVAVSEQVAAPLERRALFGTPAIKIIQNGIDTDISDRVQPRTKMELGLPADAFVIGAVGRCVPIKRFDYLLSVFAQLQIERVYLVLIGSGQQEAALRALASSLGVVERVLFLGSVSALHYYALFDCFVQPSAKEGISLALLEAMYAARPCVVMGYDEYHPVIQHKRDGLVVDPEDQMELEGAIKRFYADHDFAQRLGEEARRKVREHFSVEKMIHQYKSLFSEAAHQ